MHDEKNLKIIPLAIILLITLVTITASAQQTPQLVPINAKTITIQKIITPQETGTLVYNHPDAIVLSPHSAIITGPFIISLTQGLGVYVVWTPSNATIFVGVVNANTWSGYGTYVSGGSTFLLFVPGPGSWYVLISNPNSYNINIQTLGIFIVNLS